MIAWPLSRFAGTIARLCGASPEAVNGVRMAAAGLMTPFDPIGGPIGIAHAAAAESARTGSADAKALNRGMSVASWVIPIIGVPLPDPDPTDYSAD